MTLLSIILLAIIFIMLFLLGFLFLALSKALNRITSYEEFYESTLEDLHYFSVYMENLMQHEIVSSDPNIKAFAKCLNNVYRVILGYRNAFKKGADEKKNQAKKG